MTITQTHKSLFFLVTAMTAWTSALVTTQTLERNQPGKFFDVDYPIPADLTAGKDSVVVRLQSRPGKTAGGVFGVWILKK